LDDIPRIGNPNDPSQGVNPHLWLENAHTGSSVDTPPSFDSLDTPTDDGRAKEIAIREDNLKFPQSMKLERLQPEVQRDLSSLQRPYVC